MSDTTKMNNQNPDGRMLPLSRPCMSWRQSGGFWSISEDGNGERLRISNSVRDSELSELNDKDLEILQQLIGTAIWFRKIHGPHAEASQSAGDNTPTP